MRQFLLFILPILTIVTLSVLVFGFIQSRSQQEKASDDLMRKLKAIAESTEIAAQNIIKKKDTLSAKKLVESFQKREQMQGYVLYDLNMNSLAIIPPIAAWYKKDAAVLKNVLTKEQSLGSYKTYEGYNVYRLNEAILINPYSIEEFAESIKTAIEMPDKEKHRRMVNTRSVIDQNNVFRWAGKNNK